MTRLYNSISSSIKPIIGLFTPDNSEFLEVILLYSPFFFLIFPQESGYWHAQVIFWLFPFLYFFVIVSRPRKISPYLKTYTILWLLFLSSLALSTITSASRGLSLLKLTDYLSIFFFSIYFYLIVDTKEKLRLFFNLVIITGLVLLALSIYFQIFTSASIAGLNLFYPNHGHNHIASFLIIALPISLYFAFTHKSRKPKAIYSLISLLFFVQLLFSFSRSTLLILPIIFFLLVPSLKPSKQVVRLLIFFSVIPILIFLSIFFFSSFSNLGTSLNHQQIRSHWLWRQAFKPLAEEQRLDYWHQALSAFTHSPLLGYGPGTFRLVSYRYRQQVGHFTFFAHNHFLEVLAEQGLLGFLTLTALTLFFIKVAADYYLKTPQKSPENLLLILIIIAILAQSMVDFNLNYYLIQSLYWISIAILLRSIPAKPSTITSHFLKLYLVLATIGLALGTHQLLVKATSILGFDKKPPTTLYTSTFIYNPQEAADLIADQYMSSVAVSQDDLKLIQFLHPNHPDVISKLASYYLTSSDTTHGLNLLHQAITLNPQDTGNYTQLFRYYSGAHQTQESIRLFVSAYQNFYKNFNPTDPDLDLLSPQLNVSSLSTDFSQDQLILDLIEKSLVNDDLYYSSVFYLMGHHYLSTNQPDKALLLWQLASKTSPDWSHFQIELALLYYQTGQINQALTTLKSCIDRPHPKLHCLEFLPAISSPDSPTSPGTLKEQFLNQFQQIKGPIPTPQQP